MPLNKDKTTKLADLLERVQRRLEDQGRPDALSFFESFVKKDLARKLVEQAQADPQSIEMELAPGDFDVIYPFTAHLLYNAAARNYSEIHSDAYSVANTVSEAFCAELNEFFECSGEDGLFDLIIIRSVVEFICGATDVAK